MRNFPANAVRLTNFVAIVFLLFGASRVQAMVDANTNGMSDVWEQIHGASGVATNVDLDGDGFSNLQESIAGTDPFDAIAFPKISNTAVSGTNFVATIPSALGKLYQLQSCPALTNVPLGWTNEASVVVRSGTNVTFPVPANLAQKFFRMVISDVDSDGDGLTDWEEYQLGLDPLNADSNSHLDNNGRLFPITSLPPMVSRRKTS